MIIAAKKLLYGALAMFFCAVMIVISVNLPQKLSEISASGENAEKIPIVLVDAGHGGVDGGAVSSIDGTVEKTLNLQIALKLRDMLRMLGVQVKMTRESDVSIHDEDAQTIRRKKVTDLKNRLNMLDNGCCDALISVHMNIFSQSKYHGTQVFYGGLNPESEALAKSVQKSVISLIQPDNNRTQKKSTKSIYLLYNAKKPAIMVECGFLSNSDDLARLKTEKYQLQMAEAICNGFMNYKYGGSAD